MSGDAKRSILGDLKKPLLQPSTAVPAELEERLLGTAPAEPASAPPPRRREARTRVATVPVTFHLPVELRDRIKITAQAKQKTMLEIAMEALEEYLARNPVLEADLKRLLGL